MVSNQIASDIELFFNWGAASSLGVLLLALTLAFLYIASRLTRLEHLVGEGSR
jgi:putative spermidine/putrescine transport system permease protein/spermidine/putrescine transport system permease protein